MTSPEYMFLPINIIPEHIINKYNFKRIVKDNKVYIQIHKGMYGLPQAGRLSHQQLIKVLEPHVYYPCIHASGI